MFNIQFVIDKPLDPDLIKNKLSVALDGVGQSWVDMVGEQPAPTPDALHDPTGKLADSAGYEVDDSGLFVSLGTVYYGRWVLITGAGLFGPTGSPIRPTQSQFLAIPVTNKSSSANDFASEDGIIFARSTVGFPPWPNFARWKPLVPEIIKKYLVI